NYWGYYLQVGWFLTGEQRGYDRRFGIWDRVLPFENFFLVRDRDGKPQFGWGAFELLYRWDFLDLDSKGVNGGRLGQHTLGLTWFISSQARIMVNLNIAHNGYNLLTPNPVYDPTKKVTGTNTPLIFSNVATGQTEGLGVRMHFDF